MELTLRLDRQELDCLCLACFVEKCGEVPEGYEAYVTLGYGEATIRMHEIVPPTDEKDSEPEKE